MKWLLASALLLSACGGGDANRPPPPPPSDGGIVHRPGPVTRDGSVDGSDAAIDAGADATMDAGAGTCLSLPATGNELSLAFVSATPAPDFTPARAVATWLDASCSAADPELIVSLGAGCDPLSGERLAFRISRGAIQRGELPVGFPLFVENPHSYAVRLVLPPSVGPEPSIWGDCGAAAGSITFDDIGWTAGAIESASFDITLDDCSSTPALERLRVTGSFLVTLPDAFDDVCTP